MPDPHNPNPVANLRAILAELYPDEASMRRLIADAGLNAARITLTSNAINNWHAIWSEAEKTDKVDGLLDAALHEYGENAKLQAACAAHRSSVQAGGAGQKSTVVPVDPNLEHQPVVAGKSIDIFLSYSRQDAAIMRRLLGDLRSAGFRVWIDETELEPGSPSWQAAIEQAIQDARCMVVILSPESKQSKWVEIEVSIAEESGFRVFPVLARGDNTTAVLFRLRTAQLIDIRNDWDPVKERLIPALHRHLSPGTGEVVAARLPIVEKAKPVKSRWQWGTGLAALLVLVVGIVYYMRKLPTFVALTNTSAPSPTIGRVLSLGGTSTLPALPVHSPTAAATPVAPTATTLPTDPPTPPTITALPTVISRPNPTTTAQVKSDNSDYAIAYINDGQAWAEQGKWDEAITDYDKAIQLNPDYAKAYIYRGLARYVQRQLNEAITDYDKAIQLNPDYAEAYIYRGLARYVQGKLNEAIADYDKAIQLNPYYAEAYNNRGLARADQGKLDEAIADYDKAIQLNPNYAEVHNNRGDANYHQGKLEAAIADYDKVILLDPKNAQAYVYRGIAKHNLARPLEAVADFDKAIALNSQYAPAFLGRGYSYHNLGKLKEEVDDFNRYIELQPNADNRAEVEKMIAEAEATLAKLR